MFVDGQQGLKKFYVRFNLQEGAVFACDLLGNATRIWHLATHQLGCIGSKEEEDAADSVVNKMQTLHPAWLVSGCCLSQAR